MTTIEQTLEKDPIGTGLNILEYIVYLDAGKEHISIFKTPTNKKWWEFWKPSFTDSAVELTNIEKAVRGKDWLSRRYIQPYHDLLERIKKFAIKSSLAKPKYHEEFLDLATDVLYSCPHGERLFTYDDMTKFLRMLEMKRVFIKVVDGNHQECIDYLVSLGAANRSNWRGTKCADSYRIDSKGDVGWADESGWGWCAANGYTEVFLPETTHPKRHPHHDLIVQWASDPSQKVWGKQTNGEYVRLEYPSWMPKLDYYVGETPPANLEPVLYENTLPHVTYYIADPTKDCLYDLRCNFTEAETVLLDRKLVYYTYEGAIKRAKEMLGIED